MEKYRKNRRRRYFGTLRMMSQQRLKLKKTNNYKTKSKTTSFLLGSVFFSFILALVIIFKAGRNLEESITDYATIESKRIATTILNDVIRNYNFSEKNLYLVHIFHPFC